MLRIVLYKFLGLNGRTYRKGLAPKNLTFTNSGIYFKTWCLNLHDGF